MSAGGPSLPACVPPSRRSRRPAATAPKTRLRRRGPDYRALFYFHGGALDVGFGAQDVDGAEALQVQPLEVAAQLVALTADDRGGDRPGAGGVPLKAKVQGQGEGNGDGCAALAAGGARGPRPPPPHPRMVATPR